LRFGNMSPLTLRILAVNLIALGFLFAGTTYLDEYRRGLVNAQLAKLEGDAKVFAAAIGESASSPENVAGNELVPLLAQQMVRRLVEASNVRARLFDDTGALIADSLYLLGPGGLVEVKPLPPPAASSQTVQGWLARYDRIVDLIWRPKDLPLYVESGEQAGGGYSEVAAALAGTAESRLRRTTNGALVLSVATPVQRYKEVLGALMLSKGAADIDAAVLKVRLDLVKWFLVAFAVTVLLSLYLAGTISRPIGRLAQAAKLVRRDRGRRHLIPDFGDRLDEIGDLANELREMTEALWDRIDAIEQFALDVAHEIKNPLSSLRSAVETAARVSDPSQRERLMSIILQDVGRLDRLISDISNASRLDAELSRATSEPVDIGRMMEAIVEVTETTADQRKNTLALNVEANSRLIVNGLEDRLVQVFRNLIANAMSFTPEGGVIELKAGCENGMVVAEVADHGPGIPEGREKDIFTRFYSERPKGETFGVHSGLGLSISKQIVEAHGGTIVAENRRAPDGTVTGARFIVRLPAFSG
jgi:two-component system, OmpR family, sensor histidine kinase ChvG